MLDELEVVTKGFLSYSRTHNKILGFCVFSIGVLFFTGLIIPVAVENLVLLILSVIGSVLLSIFVTSTVMVIVTGIQFIYSGKRIDLHPHNSKPPTEISTKTLLTHILRSNIINDHITVLSTEIGDAGEYLYCTVLLKNSYGVLRFNIKDYAHTDSSTSEFVSGTASGTGMCDVCESQDSPCRQGFAFVPAIHNNPRFQIRLCENCIELSLSKISCVSDEEVSSHIVVNSI